MTQLPTVGVSNSSQTAAPVLDRTARARAEHLESFISVKNYEDVLLYLEAQLYNQLPNVYCPSSFEINVLLTIATLSEYNNADMIRKEFSGMSSEKPVHIRALQLLQFLVEIVQNRENHTREFMDGGSTPNPEYIKPESIDSIQAQLIHSLSFLKVRPGKDLRSRAKKKDYYEKLPLDPLEQIGSSPPTKPKSKEDDALEWSPQKKQLEMFVQRLNTDAPKTFDFDDDDDEEFETPADKKSYQILKNQRSDVSLSNDRMITAIQWAIQCANSSTPLKQEVWKLWKPILTFVFDVLHIELDAYQKIKEKSDHEYVSSTLTELLMLQVGRSDWAKQLMEALLPTPKDRTQQIFPNELEVAKSYHIAPTVSTRGHALLIAPDAIPLLKNAISLASRWCVYREGDIGITVTRAKYDYLCEAVSLRIHLAGTPEDLIYFCRTNALDPDDKEWATFTFTVLTHMLTQITTYKFANYIEEDFIFDSSSKSIEAMFQNVTYLKKDYYMKGDGDWGYKRFKENYSKMNIILFALFELWIQWGQPKLTANKKKTLLKLAKEGQAKRYAVLESGLQMKRTTAEPDSEEEYEIDEDGLFNLCDVLELRLEDLD